MKEYWLLLYMGSQELVKNASESAEALYTEVPLPRVAARVKHQSSSLTEYFRCSLYVPYLDSLIGSLETRFREDQLHAFALISLHP